MKKRRPINETNPIGLVLALSSVMVLARPILITNQFNSPNGQVELNAPSDIDANIEPPASSVEE